MKNIQKDRDSITNYADQLKSKGRITPIIEEAIEKARLLKKQYSTICYIAGGLTGMSEEVKSRYSRLSELLAANQGMFGYAPHLHGTDPVAHPDVTPEEVRDVDFLFAAVVPDYHINCWYPVAHGNAVEAGWAELNHIPSLYLVPEGVILSRLVRGMHNIAGIITYNTFESDGVEEVQHFINTKISA